MNKFIVRLAHWVYIEEGDPDRHARKLISTLIKLIVITAITLIVAYIPTSTLQEWGLTGLTTTQHRVIAIFIFAALMWLSEALDAWVTSLLVALLLLLTVSTSAIAIGSPDTNFGTPVPYADIMHCFANPTIMLFLGGFILAIAMTKTKIDVVLAKILLKPFGTKSNTVLLGFLLVTAIFSAFVSNTATAAMMFAFLGPIRKALPKDRKGRIALTLAIPVGANLGGLITPIGTPPNLIVMDNLKKFNGIDISFAGWMATMIPFVLLLLFIAGLFLRMLFPFKQKTIKLEIEGDLKKDFQTTSVIVGFIVTVFLWMFGNELLGLNTYVVAMIPIALFAATGVINRRDLGFINWSILWMVAGGFALGVALDKTGLGQVLVEAIPFDSWSPLLVIVSAGLFCYAFSVFISNSAATSLLAPILGLVASGIAADPTAGPTFTALGGPYTLMVGVAIAASAAMVLPISTPPNAIAYSTRFIKQIDMMKIGALVGVTTLTLGYIMLIILA